MRWKTGERGGRHDWPRDCVVTTRRTPRGKSSHAFLAEEERTVGLRPWYHIRLRIWQLHFSTEISFAAPMLGQVEAIDPPYQASAAVLCSSCPPQLCRRPPRLCL